jgi:hypothetical protein
MSAYTTDTDSETRASTPDERLLERAKRCAKKAWEAETGQREREIKALQFQVGDLQWDEAAKAARGGGVIGSQQVPPRPMLSISKLDQPIQLVLNQARSAQLGVNIHPVSEDADDDTAEVFDGLYKRIVRDSNGDQARMWALDRATKCGRGVYRVNTKFDEDAPDGSFDQEIVIERILHQDSVYFDPSAKRPDFSDGDWAIECIRYSRDEFKREFPDAKNPIDSAGDFRAMASIDPDWFDGDGETGTILVVCYWFKDHDVKEVIRQRDGAKFKRDTVTVKRAFLNAMEVLGEVEEWNGKYIPLIPVIGRELQPWKGSERRFVGMVEPAMDAQKFHNYAASNMAERMALEPKAPWVMAEGMDAGYETEWQQSNVRNLSVLHYKPKGLSDQREPAPTRAQLDQTGMSMAVQGIEMSDNWIQGTTGIYDPSLGRESSRDKSGRAILALQQQADAGNNHYLASLADTSLPYEARVILDLIPTIYDRPGRITRILGGEDDLKPVMLNAPFKMDPDSQRPIPATPGEPGAKQYDLSKGKYTVAVSIGKSYQTRMQEGQEEIGAILQADPSLMPLIGSIYFRYRDSPGSKEIADILKEVRIKQYGKLGSDKDAAPSPEEMQAELQVAQQKIQELEGIVQQAQQALATDQAKQQATIAKAEMDNRAKVEIAAQQQAGKQREGEATVLLERMEQEFERMQAEADRRFEEWKVKFEAAHETGLEAAKGRTMTRTREDGREEGREDEQEQSGGSSRSSEQSGESGPAEVEASE